MKISLVLRPVRPLTRSEAWGCFTANLALPGSGSLVAGRAVGYWQAAMYMAGFVMTVVGGISFIAWYFTNATQINQPAMDDPFAGLGSIFRVARWAMLGFVICAFAVVWALTTSWQIVRASREGPVPPKID